VPSSTPQLTARDVHRHIAEVVFGGPRDRVVGLELEWLTRTVDGERPTMAALERIAGPPCVPLPHHSAITVEPGGQLEISTPPQPTVAAACEAAAGDLFALDETCTGHGIDLVALGHDAERPACVLRSDVPRYDAMVDYFAGSWPDALEMMTNTASLQLNLGLGVDDDDMGRRWAIANELGPVLLAAFADSPFADGAPTGCASTRWFRWMNIDPDRTTCPDLVGAAIDSWHDYCWHAPVMLVRVDDDRYEPVHGLPFGRWVERGHELGWPTADDLAYHLTTLFPPVRPRGWLEIRYLDSLPTPFWQVATTVVATVLDSEELTLAAHDVLAGTTDRWSAAATHGLHDPDLARTARRLFALVLDELEQRAPSESSTEDVQIYFDHWVSRARCPADDRLEHWHRTGELVPPAPVLDMFEGVTR
jgi:glutamate--cysteine ligase